ASSIGIFLSISAGNLAIYDNVIYDANVVLRSNQLNVSSAPYPPLVLNFYRNKIWNPPAYGGWTDLGQTDPVAALSDSYILNFYHNTFLGSSSGFVIATFYKLPNLLMVNNILQGNDYAYQTWPSQCYDERNDVGAAAFNWTYGATGNCSWETF